MLLPLAGYRLRTRELIALHLSVLNQTLILPQSPIAAVGCIIERAGEVFVTKPIRKNMVSNLGRKSVAILIQMGGLSLEVDFSVYNAKGCTRRGQQLL